MYSSTLIFPLLSVSNRSKRDRHAARNPHNPQNSSKPMVPDRSVSNMRIIILTVCASKDDQSPFTRAARSSFSVRNPLPRNCIRTTLSICNVTVFSPSLSTALKRGQSAGSAPLGGAGDGGGLEIGCCDLLPEGGRLGKLPGGGDV